MELMLLSLFVIPLLGFLVSLLFKNHREAMLSGTANATTAAGMLCSFLLFIEWLVNGCRDISAHVLTIYETGHFHFGIDLFYDKATAVYSLVSSILLFLVSMFSKFYMHRESGFKRFFNHFLLFAAGIGLVIISGNFETFFLGWEIVGISSFLLIAFYRDRYLPVRNALKVLSFYRLSDVALVGAFWFSHHLFHTNILFEQLGDTHWLGDAFQAHPVKASLIGLLLIQAASVKSAQFPFSAWLPRAIEGPTVSSAIFYGSLSVHLGVFLLLRTAPIWMPFPLLRALIIVIGLLTIITGSLAANVQPTAKTQIAYSSLAQIGFMFIEIALGWHWLALIHLAANAFLRSYQLLISPASMNYLVHHQIFHYQPGQNGPFQWLPQNLRNTLYMLALKEWNLDFAWFWHIWRPLKKASKTLHFLRHPMAEITILILAVLGFVLYIIHPVDGLNQLGFVSDLYAVIALSLILVAWTERHSAIRSWIYIFTSQMFFMLSVVQQHAFDMVQIVLYVSGTLSAFSGGMWCLYRVKTMENNIRLNEFHGHIYEHPRYALLFLICSLTMVGFPISPTFLGFDILFSDIKLDNGFLLVISSFTFVILELSVLRIYARVFLGQHVKTYHEVAFRSS